MPRQDVPYGGALCRLRERIAEIWDKLGEKLHSINGVEGDGAGDVKIVSGDAAVVVTSDQVNHEIEIALDTSQLPAASVSSVNGQTGAVTLDAGDIPSDGNSDVQSDIDALQTMDGALQGNINAEALARQNADSALQTNINTVSASLPAAAAAAVAADPTVAQLVVDLGNKVDLTDVSTVETPDTIAKRNGSGRLVAADPAIGATDKTLVTTNWVSQTGDSSPNNLVHRTGNETIKDVKTYQYQPTRAKGISQGSGNGWFKIWESETSVEPVRRTTILNVMLREQSQFAKILINRRLLNQTNAAVLYSIMTPTSIIITRDSDGKMTAWSATTRTTVWIEIETVGNNSSEQELSNVVSDNTSYPQPVASDYVWMVTI